MSDIKEAFWCGARIKSSTMRNNSVRKQVSSYLPNILADDGGRVSVELVCINAGEQFYELSRFYST
jgi:hypothetical protein